MSEVINIFIPVEPVPKGRPRLGRGGTVCTPEKTREYERLVGLYTRRAIKQPIDKDTPLHMEITLTFMPPKSWSNKKQEQAKSGDISHTVKPDVDNCVKSLLDGMNKIAFHDDSQIVSLVVTKEYGEVAGSEVIIKKAEID